MTPDTSVRRTEVPASATEGGGLTGIQRGEAVTARSLHTKPAEPTDAYAGDGERETEGAGDIAGTRTPANLTEPSLPVTLDSPASGERGERYCECAEPKVVTVGETVIDYLPLFGTTETEGPGFTYCGRCGRFVGASA